MNGRPHALYRFYDDTRTLLYVGITHDPGSRWPKHMRDKPWWAQVTHIDLESFPDRPSVLAAEESAIHDERPLYNVVHNSPDDRSRLVRVVQASDMPDECHDFCSPAGVSAMYYPYRWDSGIAHYQCAAGHRWTCTWGHRATGSDPLRVGLPIGNVLWFDPDDPGRSPVKLSHLLRTFQGLS
jgi:predicted GIY-YIG superfamily endonuclease